MISLAAFQPMAPNTPTEKYRESRHRGASSKPANATPSVQPTTSPRPRQIDPRSTCRNAPAPISSGFGGLDAAP
jgi:hypothetical protein